MVCFKKRLILSMFLCRRRFYSDLRRLKKLGASGFGGGGSNFSNLLAPWASGSRSLMLRAGRNEDVEMGKGKREDQGPRL